MDTGNGQQRAILQRIAHRVMIARGLAPDFAPEALAQLAAIVGPAPAAAGPSSRDLRDLLWCSIDNDDSMDLDQLSVAQELPGGGGKLLVAIADVDALVGKGSAVDDHARTNTTSVYTAAEIFPMLPEKLSTDLTSLADSQDRQAVVVEIVVGADGSIAGSDVYRAAVRNHAKLAYDSLAAWLEGNGPVPAALAAVPGLAGRKMSKSYGNTIELAEEPKSLEAKIKRMYTDPAKIKMDDKGHPEGCVVFAFHKLYNPAWAARLPLPPKKAYPPPETKAISHFSSV